MDQIEEFMKHSKQELADKYRVLNTMAVKGQILFTGSSLMEQFPINELMMNDGSDKIIYNRGIGGSTIPEMLEHMEEQIFGTEPSKIFINIGTNDIARPDYTPESLINNYETLLLKVKERLPETKVYLMAYYPVNETDKLPDGDYAKDMFATRTNENINIANAEVEKLAAKLEYEFINVNEGLSDERGKLKKEFTVEGIHMYANAYRIILNNLKRYL